MDALGSPNDLDCDFELIPNADGGGVESLMCLLRSQLRQAGVHSVSSTGTSAATDSQPLSKLHSLDLSVGVEPVEVGVDSGVGADLVAGHSPVDSSLKSQSLEVHPSNHIVFHVLRMATSYNYCRTFCKISRMLWNATRECRLRSRRRRANCCKHTFSGTATEPWKPCCSTLTRCAKSWVVASCRRCNIQPSGWLLCFAVIDMMCVARSSRSFFRCSFVSANGISRTMPQRRCLVTLCVRRFRYHALFMARWACI
jgi:hypothetical protein